MDNSKTFVIGDTHLQFRQIKQVLSPLMTQHKPQHLIFVGDYTDQWGQCRNNDLYLKELDLLLEFKRDMETQGIRVTYLLGNHDVAYITGHLMTYSNISLKIQSQIRAKLRLMDCRLSIKSNGYVISHAGFAGNSKVRGVDKLPSVKTLAGLSDTARFSLYASCLWLRPDELLDNPSQWYPKQIFGHTPTKTIQIDPACPYINVDTFSLTRDYRPIGDGSILMLNDGEAEKLTTGWLDLSHQLECFTDLNSFS